MKAEFVALLAVITQVLVRFLHLKPYILNTKCPFQKQVCGITPETCYGLRKTENVDGTLSVDADSVIHQQKTSKLNYEASTVDLKGNSYITMQENATIYLENTKVFLKKRKTYIYYMTVWVCRNHF